MKKVSFIKGLVYNYYDVFYLPDEIKEHYFEEETYRFHTFTCTESFTAEITVKILPYEES